MVSVNFMHSQSMPTPVPPARSHFNQIEKNANVSRSATMPAGKSATLNSRKTITQHKVQL